MRARAFVMSTTKATIFRNLLIAMVVLAEGLVERVEHGIDFSAPTQLTACLAAALPRPFRAEVAPVLDEVPHESCAKLGAAEKAAEAAFEGVGAERKQRRARRNARFNFQSGHSLTS
mmetsp:Transcript_74175/g.144937  ORF Transcript_74175/g.144937 Transcript_74175/m.144937 type:complete len:117 (-) Transcript_74175:444-794(-)